MQLVEVQIHLTLYLISFIRLGMLGRSAISRRGVKPGGEYFRLYFLVVIIVSHCNRLM
jgi:hypothetical protein